MEGFTDGLIFETNKLSMETSGTFSDSDSNTGICLFLNFGEFSLLSYMRLRADPSVGPFPI